MTPLPVTQAVPDVTADGWVSWTRSGSREHLPDEFVLRELLDVDTDQIQDVLGLVVEHGPIAQRPRPWTTEPSEQRPGQTPLLDLGLWVDTLQALVRTWFAALDADDVVEPLRSLPLVKGLTTDQAWHTFAELMNEGLGATYRVRVEYRDDDGASLQTPEADLVAAACLQLYNLMLDDVPVRTCANETCGRRFVRQRGGARYVEHRHSTGVLYCTPNCARAQAQRQYRRRKRQEGRS